MNKRGKRVVSKVLSLVLSLVLAFTMLAGVEAVQTKAATIPVQSGTPSEGCVFITVKGEYKTEAAAAIKRINQIRYEACREGVVLNGQKLTLSDYVPIKWSAGLEKIARIRAAESSYIIGHERMNGKSVFDFDYPSGGYVTGEVLAWNWSDGMLMGIEQWYDEKSDYVNNVQGAVTGHYTAMIKPTNNYIGIGTFINENAPYRNTTAAQFMNGSGLSETKAKATGVCYATVEVLKSKITAIKVSGKSTIDRAQKTTLTLAATTTYTGTAKHRVTAGASWKSSNTSVATVSSKGVVTGLKKGSAKITATVGGKSSTFTVNVTGTCAHSYSGKIVSRATAKADGKIKYTCSVCGKVTYKTVYRLASIRLSRTSFKYDGKVKTPTVTVKDRMGNVIAPKFYKVTYSAGRVNAGTYKVKITFLGRYNYTSYKTFTIVK